MLVKMLSLYTEPWVIVFQTCIAEKCIHPVDKTELDIAGEYDRPIGSNPFALLFCYFVLSLNVHTNRNQQQN